MLKYYKIKENSGMRQIFLEKSTFDNNENLTFPSRASLIKIEKIVNCMAQINLFYIVNSCILYGEILLRSAKKNIFKYFAFLDFLRVIEVIRNSLHDF